MKREFNNTGLKLKKIKISKLDMKMILGGASPGGGSGGIGSCTCPPPTNTNTSTRDNDQFIEWL